MFANRRQFLVSSVLSVIALGCGGGSNLPKGETGTVTGKITFQGQPIPKDSVVLFVNSAKGMNGTGVVDSTGTYRLTMREGSAIIVGEYRVAVTPPPPPASTLSQEEIMKLGMENKLPQAPEVKEIPKQYRNAESSPLTTNVKKGENTLDFDLKL